ncbi:CLAVATA3/ESR (CLE)-related protein 10-like [Neltuma alba]|uniref:CLAVATA3/ESR (CLE)-related protein 10-like n=1 Tax=Neltuma alba TaxID=207710 RepID=UPI0010A4D183|nr:CLAVATA3/ESR (CLE)-related protein 10-like [Prosopis alba]
MKSSLSSSTPPSSFFHPNLILLLLLYLLFFVCSVNCRNLPPSTTALHHQNHRLHHRRCESFSKETPRSLCFQLQRIHKYYYYYDTTLHRPLPSQMTNSDKNSEIDPRYGVQKRLVPTGPNPLHN